MRKNTIIAGTLLLLGLLLFPSSPTLLFDMCRPLLKSSADPAEVLNELDAKTRAVQGLNDYLQNVEPEGFEGPRKSVPEDPSLKIEPDSGLPAGGGPRDVAVETIAADTSTPTPAATKEPAVTEEPVEPVSKKSVVVATADPPPPASPVCVEWRVGPYEGYFRSVNEAILSFAAGKRKPLFIFITLRDEESGAPACPGCVAIEKQVFNDPLVAASLNKHFYPVKLYADTTWPAKDAAAKKTVKDVFTYNERRPVIRKGVIVGYKQVPQSIATKGLPFLAILQPTEGPGDIKTLYMSAAPFDMAGDPADNVARFTKFLAQYLPDQE